MFNRRASRSRGGKVNDPALWVWSNEPAHEPLIPKWMYDELNAHRQQRRDDNTLNAHPETLRTYVYRGMLFCQCGRRMNGNVRHNAASYMCWPKNNNRGRPDKYAGHPKAVYIREDAVMGAVSRFFAERVFGPERHAALSAVAALDAADDAAPARPDTADVDLLDALPYLTGNLSDAPEPLLRKLFEAVSLTVRIADDGDHVIINVRLPGDTMPEIISTAETINNLTSDPHETPGHSVTGARVDAVRAPGGSRTHTAVLLRDLPLPLGYGGAAESVSATPHGRCTADQEAPGGVR